jgi:hypothetical protein
MNANTGIQAVMGIASRSRPGALPWTGCGKKKGGCEKWTMCSMTARSGAGSGREATAGNKKAAFLWTRRESSSATGSRRSQKNT